MHVNTHIRSNNICQQLLSKKRIIYLNHMPSSSSLVSTLLQLRADVQSSAINVVFKKNCGKKIFYIQKNGK